MVRRNTLLFRLTEQVILTIGFENKEEELFRKGTSKVYRLLRL